MMQWISDWLREIVLVILLAAFIDLMLPNSSMQRYVKVVVSLFILLTILSPIITLFKSDLDFMDWRDQTVEMGAVQPLESIMENGKKIREQNEQQSIQFVEHQMADMMKTELEKELPGKIRKVDVNTELNADHSQLEIKKVDVTVISDAEPNAGRSTSTELVAPIEPVVVNIEVNNSEEIDSVNSVEDDEMGESQVKKQVFRIMEDKWSVSAKQLNVTFEGTEAE
jgi:stage III sporulation protein AF